MQHKSFLPLGVGKNKEIAELVLKLALLLGPTLWGHLTLPSINLILANNHHLLLLVHLKLPLLQ